jgi:hypothetical protein
MICNGMFLVLSRTFTLLDNSRSDKSRLLIALCALCPILAVSGRAGAQASVYTAQGDMTRSGQYLSETILTPANVNATTFGKLFSQPVTGTVQAQPLFVANVTVPGLGPHNVLYVATLSDYVYAFDADNNGGTNANPLWSVFLANSGAPAGQYQTVLGVLGTPVIDPATNTMYLVSSESQAGAPLFRLHALDITTGGEKFGGPMSIQASVPGTGSGSVNGSLTFNASVQRQRPGLLLLNGIVYLGFGSNNDNGAWHGWIMSYNAATLAQISVFCTSANGSGGGIWMGGSGLAAEVNDPAKPYGRLFFATGNGSYSASVPYSNAMSYAMSVLDLDLTGGVLTVQDEFTPSNQAILDAQDGDLGSGGPILLPPMTLASGQTQSALMEIGKSGDLYLLNRNNLGGFNAAGNQILESVQTPEGAYENWGYGVWGATAYWNGNLYLGGTSPSSSNSLLAYSFNNGQLSATPTSQSAYQFCYPGPMPSVSANGATNGIVWVLGLPTGYTLLAYDATNLANQLYSSRTNPSRDSAGINVAFTHPVIANGKVYVGGSSVVSIYGLLGATPTTASPIFVTPAGSFSGTLSVALTDATANSQIYYTTDGSMPTVNSTLYTGPISISATATVTAFASAPGNLQSAPVASTYSALANAANPVFSLAAGTYAGTQTVTLTDSSASPAIYYTVAGPAPASAYTLYTQPITVPVSETVQAYAIAPNLQPSSVVSAVYTIQPPYTFNFSQGFAEAQGPIQFNGSTGLDDFRLQLANGGLNETGSAFYTTQVDASSFTTDFVFQISSAVANGMTFTFEKGSPAALGGAGSGLGYSGINHSMAIKFDVATPIGAGQNSVGLFANGALPTTPAIDLTGTGINLRSGDQMDAHLTYDGTTLNMTLTDVLTLAKWSHSWIINIPATIGGPHAYVGFTGGTGAGSSSQKVTAWSWLQGMPVVPNFPVGFDSMQLIQNGGPIVGTALEATYGGQNFANSIYFATPVGIDTFTTDFDFTVARGSTSTLGEGFTFVIQNQGKNAVGGTGGSLGYGGIQNSVAIKFDLYNNAGEGTDSTGLYIDGATPTVPSVNLTGTGIVLSSGHSIHSHIVYNGTNLTLTLTDNVTAATWSNAFAVNIPAIVGANTAYVGFAGGTSTATAIQSIVDWTYTTP